MKKISNLFENLRLREIVVICRDLIDDLKFSNDGTTRDDTSRLRWDTPHWVGSIETRKRICVHSLAFWNYGPFTGFFYPWHSIYEKI
jgi:hypothetical protein